MKRLVLIAIVLLLTFYFSCMNYAEPIDAPIARNRFSGELSLQQSGWHITPPWVFVSVIDTTPLRVCVPTSGRDVSCKLVQFKREAFKEFVSTQGFYYWWWSNRISINLGYDDEYRGMKDILRGYAYSGTAYPFLEINKVYGKQ